MVLEAKPNPTCLSLGDHTLKQVLSQSWWCNNTSVFHCSALFSICEHSISCWHAQTGFISSSSPKFYSPCECVQKGYLRFVLLEYNVFFFYGIMLNPVNPKPEVNQHNKLSIRDLQNIMWAGLTTPSKLYKSSLLLMPYLVYFPS